MLLSKTLTFYKRPEIQKQLIEQAKDKEIGIRFEDFFGKRPDVLLYENDVLDFAKKKATSFHCSEELWKNPLHLKSEIRKQEMDELRKGWDLILDIDCKHFLYSKIATHLIILMLKELGIESITCKFSGNKGFHIAVPFEAFPDTVNGQPTKSLFPDAPRRMAFYLRDKLTPLLAKAIMKAEKNSFENVVRRTGISATELVSVTDSGKRTLKVESFLEIDTILLAPRHLYRMPYSLHEKSLLVSVPVKIDEVLKFRKEQAEPEKVVTNIPFLDRTKVKKGEASRLIINAFDFYPKEEEAQRERKEFTLPEEAIHSDYFPPCIKIMFNGMGDGKKRALFTLINFLKGAGWSMDAIDEKIHDWNKLNPEPLREVYLKGQLRQAAKSREIMPPHNCKSYYQDLGVCNPDNFCQKIKNPLQYAKFKSELVLRQNNKGTRKLTNEQKEMRRKHRESQSKPSS